MARLAAREKACFYPLPPITQELLCKLLVGHPEATILDPCAGEGVALAALGKATGCRTVANELDKERAAACEGRCDVALQGPIEFLRVTGRVGCLYLNPPYDTDPQGKRMEHTFLEIAFGWLVEGGVLVFVVPIEAVTKRTEYGDRGYLTKTGRVLAHYLDSIEMYRLPDGEFEMFKQVVIIGTKRLTEGSYRWDQEQKLQGKLTARPRPLDRCVLRQSIPITDEVTVTQAVPHAAETLAEAVEFGVSTTDAFKRMTEPGFTQSLMPLLPLRGGHAAFAVAGGLVDGVEIKDDNGTPLLVKGICEKDVAESTEQEPKPDGGTRTTRVLTERAVTTITTLNLKTAEVEEVSSRNWEEFSEFLTRYQETFIRAIRENFPPLFKPDRDIDKWVPALSRVHGPGKLPGRAENGLLGVQQLYAAALADYLKTNRPAILSGEMGVGKTCVTTVTMGAMLNNKDVVVMCPGQVAEKWARESEAVLQEFGTHAHVVGEKRKQAHLVLESKGWAWTNAENEKTGLPNAMDHVPRVASLKKVAKPILDVQNAFKKARRTGRPAFIILTFETSKNDSPWKHICASGWRRARWFEQQEVSKGDAWRSWTETVDVEKTAVMQVATCPDCGSTLRVSADEYAMPLPLDLEKKGPWGKKKRFCDECGAALWQKTAFNYGGRVAAALYINRHCRQQYTLIIDEAHNTKAGDTDIGQASQLLISGAYKHRVIAMTGTIYAGFASSVFYLLYRLSGAFRKRFEFGDLQKFIDYHGLSKHIETRHYAAGRNVTTSAWGYDRKNTRSKEIPGVTPGIVIWLLNLMAPLKLADLGFDLPPYKEVRMPVKLDEQLERYSEAINDARATAVEHAVKGKMGMLSQWMHLALAGLDCPIDEELTLYHDGELVDSVGIQGILSSPDQWPAPLFPKDAVICALIKQEIDAGRGCGVFFEQVNRRPWLERIKRILNAKYGIWAEVLTRDTCHKTERMEWYRGFVKRCKEMGQPPVLLTNGDLVREGVDLVELPTIIETSVCYKINNLRQRDRRSWRITQDKPVKVIFVYYEGSWQEIGLCMVAEKMKAAQLVEGELASGLAVEMGEEESAMDKLMAAVMSGTDVDLDWSGFEAVKLEEPEAEGTQKPERAEKKTSLETLEDKYRRVKKYKQLKLL